VISLLLRIFGWMRSRILWVAIGIVALFLLIWYFGPLFSFGEFRPLESESARVWLIGLILAYILVRFLLGRWRAARINDRIANLLRPTTSAAPAEDAAEIGILRNRFSEALGVLRKARFEKTKPSLWARVIRHGRYVYELPWYVIIGAPGVGKTTALLNSGLSFPLSKHFGASAIRGSGGTRDCDWWFTNEAVFIDTAGRYTTHESDVKVDKAEWLGFLSLLKKYRTQQPVNGALVVLSVAELLDLTREQRMVHAATLRSRLDELRNDLGTTFPVYLLVNKCDLLLGFNEYFSTLDHSGREQIWGFTLPLTPPDKFDLNPEKFSTEFDLLSARITAGLIDNLQSEPDVIRRELIYTFPQQFDVLTHILREMLPELFSTSPYSASPFLRGIYFTSATQEGTPFDRIVHALGQNAPVRRTTKVATAGEGKAFFLRDLLTKVVFPEAYVGGADRRATRLSRAFHIGAYVGCVLALCVAIIGWLASYRNNVTYIAEIDQRQAVFARELGNLEAVDRQNIDINVLLPILNLAETLPDSVFFKADDPWLSRTLGLYQGRKLKAATQPLYQSLLKHWLAPALKVNLEQWLRSVGVDDTEFAYEILKAYVMMHEPEHFHADEFVAFAETAWAHDFPEGELPEERNALRRHVKALIAMDGVLPSTPMDKALVQETRSRLTQYTASQRIYRRLLRVLKENTLPNFSVSAEVGEQAAQVFRSKSNTPLTSGVPSLYTYRGYHELFEPELGRVVGYIGRDEPWVLGVPNTHLRDAKSILSGELELEVKRQYMNDYVAQWEKYLDDITLVEARSLVEATVLVRTLSAVDSPLFRFLKGATRETTLLKSSAPKDSKSSLPLPGILQDPKKILPSSVRNRISAPSERPEMIVDNRFAELRRVIGGEDASASPVMAAFKAFEELYLMLAAAEQSRLNGTPPPKSDLPVRMRADAARLPQPVRGFMETVANKCETLIARADREVVSRGLRSNVTNFCQESIRGRYPFSPNTKEVTPGDFAKMFGPGGDMDRYFQTNLASVTDTSSRPWKLYPGAQGGLGGGQASLSAFEKASVIRDVFFRSAAGVPQIALTITPMVMDGSITSLTMDIDGKTIRYQHGPQLAYAVNWPGTRGGQEVRISLEPPLPQGQGDNSIVRSGAWALYRLFDAAQIIPGESPERFKAVFTIGGRKATFEVVASSVKNPLRLSELKTFTCPAGL
jgi:type VI secretion system protein ImpL